jgi:hypothetical protein
MPLLRAFVRARAILTCPDRNDERECNGVSQLPNEDPPSGRTLGLRDAVRTQQAATPNDFSGGQTSTIDDAESLQHLLRRARVCVRHGE